MKLLDSIHQSHFAGRRVRVLTKHLADMVPQGASVLDVGCGDGEIAGLLSQRRPDLTLTGVDVLIREHARIPVKSFDGRNLPFDDQSFDAAMFVDVLHHCEWPVDLIREGRRVARQTVLIKDHYVAGLAAPTTLRLMDWVGNQRYGVALPYNYLRPSEWQQAFDELGLSVDECRERLGIYNWPLTLIFDRCLHFLARLGVPVRPEVPSSTQERPLEVAVT